jgi:hypothetical protein
MTDISHTSDPIRPHEFSDLVNALKNCLSDEDRLRRLKASLRSFTFTTDQAKTLFDNHAFRWTSSAGPLKAASLLYARLLDADRFEEVVSLFRLEEDREELRRSIAK